MSSARAGYNGAMADRELVVLGTASQVPTRERNHNALVLRWDSEMILFDPGEGAQRQMELARISPSRVTRICITHFHGDHCLGLPGVLQRLAIEKPGAPVDIHFPSGGARHLDHLQNATVTDATSTLRLHPADGASTVEATTFAVEARPLEHRHIPTVGWRIEEPAHWHLLPDRLAATGIGGPDAGRLKEAGKLSVDGREIRIEDVAERRRGQAFALVMDTRICDAAFELARGVDLLVCEATFLSTEQHLARRYGHLTAAQAARIAADAGARRLVMTHFSSRHPDPDAYENEAREHFGAVSAARDLDRFPVPPRD